jgi:hypothetical protein
MARKYSYGDKWLPTPHTNWVVSPWYPAFAEATISTLMDDNTGRWKHKLIDSLFLPHEAEVVKSIVHTLKRCPTKASFGMDWEYLEDIHC